MEELKAQLADKDKTLAELDKKLKQVGWFEDAATLATTTLGLMTLGTGNSCCTGRISTVDLLIKICFVIK